MVVVEDHSLNRDQEGQDTYIQDVVGGGSGNWVGSPVDCDLSSNKDPLSEIFKNRKDRY